jgi:hypothetical protein
MSRTIIWEKRQTTLPPEVCEAAGLQPSDLVDWRFEDGEIRGRKVDHAGSGILDVDDVDHKTLLPKNVTITAESIVAAVRADREGS